MTYACPHCGQHLDTGTLAPGEKVACPKCQEEMEIPGSAQVATPGTPSSAPSAAAGASDFAKATSDKPEGRPGPASSSPDAHTMVESPGGERTISSFLRQQGVNGGVDLATGSEPARTEAEQAVARALTTEEHHRYEVGAQVAKGGMGAILSARDVNLRRGVAMKVMLDPKGASKEELLRFVEEAQVTGQLEHPGIVPVYELAVGSDGQVYYTMKFVKGRTLKDIIKGIAQGDAALIKNFPLSRLLTIFQKVSDAIAYAHSKRVIHRDLKPENIMVGEYGEVLVMDWGLAKILPKRKGTGSRGPSFAKAMEGKQGSGKKKPASPPVAPAYHVESARQESGIEKTMAGSIMGTPGYMAPEQAMGEIESLDERADIYALGAILYTILTLRPPVEGKNLMDLLQKVTTGDIPHPSTHNTKGKRQTRVLRPEPAGDVTLKELPATGSSSATQQPAQSTLAHLPGQRVPGSLAAVTMKALSLKPGDRYGSVSDFQKEIEAYQNGFATGAEEAGAWKQFVLLMRRNKGVFSTLAAMLVILLAAMTAYTRVNVRERVKAQGALRAYEVERVKRLGERKASAPALVKTARLFLDQKAYEDAFATLETALEYDASQPGTHLLRVAVLRQLKRYPEALAACREYTAQFPDDPDAKKLLAICEQKDKPGPLVPQEMASLLRKRGCFVFAAEQLGSSQARVELYKTQMEKAWPQGFNIYMTPDGEIIVSLATLRDKLNDLAPLQGMIIHQMDLSYGKIRDLSPLKGMPLRSLKLASCNAVTDVSPLRGLPLETLNLYATAVKDLSPLKGMHLQSLNLIFTPAADLSPLKGMPLRELHVGGVPCYVTDFSPLSDLPLETLELGVEGMRDISLLKGMKLKYLNLGRSPVRDISVLDGMPLEVFVSTSNPDLMDVRPLRNAPLRSVILTVQAVTQGMGDLRKISTLATINELPAAEFWKKYDAGEFKKK